jgi:hypothetical protein
MSTTTFYAFESLKQPEKIQINSEKETPRMKVERQTLFMYES